MSGEPVHPDSIHESVRRLMRWRYLVVAGVSVAAWVAIGSTSALAADPGHVHQANTNTSTTAVDNNDGQSTGLVSGPIVAPVTLGVQTNATGPVNLNVLGNQADSGNGAAGADQSNVSTSTTTVENRGAQSTGVVSGPIVAPVTVGVQSNAGGPANVNAGSDQSNSGNGGTGGVAQSNLNGSSTFVDNRDAQSTGVVSGPIVVPVTLGLQDNLDGPLDGNLFSNQAGSGNGADGELRQVNINRSSTVLDNEGAQSTGVVSGPIVVPVTGQLGTNLEGPINANGLSNQAGSGNAGGAGGSGGGPVQGNVNDSVTMVDNRRAQSTALGGVAGPVVAPISPQVGTNVNGPINGNAAGNQAGSGNAASGDVHQGNFNGSFTALDNRDAQSAAFGVVGVAGPVVAPISPQVGTNAEGPLNGNVLGNQRLSGNGPDGMLEQVNDNRSGTFVNNADAQSTAGAIGGAAVAGPIVAPIRPQVGTNLNGPLDVNGASNQAASGNGAGGDVRQGNFNSSIAWLNNQGAQSDAAAASLVGAAVAGPVVAPISPQVGTNVSGPGTVQAFSNQRGSGNGNDGGVEQVNANSATTFLNNAGAQSDSFAGGVVAGAVSGPVVVPVSPQVGTNVNGPVNVNAVSNQDLSGNGNGGDVRQGDLNRSFTWVDNAGAQSNSAAIGAAGAGAGAVSGPIVAPISPQVGTSVNGPADGNLFGNQRDSGNGNDGLLEQVNGNSSFTFLDNSGAQSAATAGSAGVLAGAAAVSGPVVAPVSPQVGTNFNGPLDVNGASNQQNSGNGSFGPVFEGNRNDAFTFVDNERAQSDATALAGGVGLAGAGAAAMSGPIVVPVSPQVGTNYNGPIDGNLLSSQRGSGNGNGGSATEMNANNAFTWLDDKDAQSNSSALAGAVGAFGGAGAIAASGPIVAPVSPQVGTNLNGPLDVNGASNQLGSGNGAKGDVHQLNWNSAWTGVENSGAQSDSFAAAAGLGIVAGGASGAMAASGPIVAPVSPQVGTNGNGPANLDAASSQNDSGNADAGATDQSNVNRSFTWLDNQAAQSNADAIAGNLTLLTVAGAGSGAVAGPIVAPVAPQVGSNVNGPANVNAVSNQLGSGNGDDVRQLNANAAWTGVDNRGAQSSSFAGALLLAEDEGGAAAAAVSGPVVVPVSPQVGTNVNGPVNGNLLSNVAASENDGAGMADQLNANSSFTWLDNQGAQSNALAAAASGSLCDSGAGSLAMAGPIVAPIAPQVGSNANGPLNVDGGSNSADSENGNAGDVHQLNWQSAWTGVDNRGAQSNATSIAAAAGHDAGAGALAVSGPIVAPVTPQVGTNVNGPANGDVASQQLGSGNGSGGDVFQANLAGQFTRLNNEDAQSSASAAAAALLVGGAGAGAVSGPVVVPVSGQVGTNVSGPLNANGASNQLDSGNGSRGDVRQLNWGGSWTWVDNMGAQSDASSLAAAAGAGAASVAGPIVAPVNPQVGTNVNGPANGNAFSDQHLSGNANEGAVWQASASQTWTFVDDMDAQSSASALGEVGAAVAGPIVAPVGPQVGTNLNGPINANGASNQADSGNGSLGDVHQLNWTWSWTWLRGDGAQSEATGLIAPVAVAGPIVAPISPQAGTNVNGPANADVFSNQDSSGNGNRGDVWQDNASNGLTALTNEGSSTFSDGLSGPAVIPVKTDVESNVDGPADVNGAGNQHDSGNPGGAVGDMFAMPDVANAGAVRSAGPGALAGIVVAALAGLTALASLVVTRRRTAR